MGDQLMSDGRDSEPPAIARRRVLHMIGNAHIDPVWLWQWPEGYQEIRATFRSAMDRTFEYPEFRFTLDSVAYLEWIEEVDPELFEKIRKQVDDERWEIVGGWWIEPDCNIPCGESFVRQGLYAQLYLLRKLGRIATVGCNVDPFGHHAMIPQILSRMGIDSYVFLRPQAHEKSLPGSAFWWESPDGSRVLAYRIPNEYTSPRTSVGHHIQKSIAQFPPDWEESMCFYGVGNHGGGPTKVNIESIRELETHHQMPNLLFSTPRQFFDRLRERGTDLPAVAEELQPHAVGCYAAHSGIKLWNRRAERELLTAEKWAAIARMVAGGSAATRDLEHAWKQVLFNQFHDILAGTSIEPAYDDARDQLGEAISIASRIRNRSLQAIAQRIDIPSEDGSQPVVVFNPHAFDVDTDVELEFGAFPEPAVLVDDEGRNVPLQRTRSFATVSGPRRRLVFPVRLPPLGYRTYRFRPDRTKRHLDRPLPTTTTLENELLRLTVDPATGWLSSLRDLETGVEFAPDRPAPHAVVLADETDTWSHGALGFWDEIGAFDCGSVRVVEHGPVRTVLRVESRYGGSSLAEELVLRRGARYVDVRVELDWHERLKAFKLRVPAALSDARATFEIPYGHISRPMDGAEVPGQTWVDISGNASHRQPAGLAVLNDGKHSFDVCDAMLGITVARSPVYAWHDPARLDPDGVYTYLDQGRHRFTYRLVPHAGDWHAAGVWRLAAELNQPPIAMLESSHSGTFPSRASYVEVSSSSIHVIVLKFAEDGSDDLVIRAHETAGAASEAVINVPVTDRRIQASFRPHEIKTFRVPCDSERPVVETDLLELAT